MAGHGILVRPAGRDRWATDDSHEGEPLLEIARLPGGRAWVKHRDARRREVFDSVAEAKAYVRTRYGARVA
jgi:hypothetical protein